MRYYVPMADIKARRQNKRIKSLTKGKIGFSIYMMGVSIERGYFVIRIVLCSSHSPTPFLVVLRVSLASILITSAPPFTEWGRRRGEPMRLFAILLSM